MENYAHKKNEKYVIKQDKTMQIKGMKNFVHKKNKNYVTQNSTGLFVLLYIVTPFWFI